MSSVATDLFSKIFKIINPEASNPSLDRSKSRKRPAEEVPPHTRKFRRVSDFPKTYPAVLVEEPSRTYVIPVEKSFQSRFSNSGVFGMSKYSKESRRLEPDYAQIEYSDDDDQEVIFVTQKVPRGQQQSGTSSAAKEKLHLCQSTGAKPKIYMNGGTIDDDEEEEESNENRRQNDNNRIRLVSKSPPFLTRGALMLSRVPGLHPIDRSQFKQASSNTFRQTTNASPSIMQNGSVEGLLKWGGTNLFDLKSTSNHKLNNLSSSSAKSPMVKTNLNSIVTKTLNLDERHKYFDLLKSCAPDLYNDGNNIVLSISPQAKILRDFGASILPEYDKPSRSNVPVIEQNIPDVRRNTTFEDLPPATKQSILAESFKIAQTILRKVSPEAKRNIPIPTGFRGNVQNPNLQKVSPPVTKRNIPIPTGSRQIPQNVNLPKVPKVSSTVPKRNIPVPTGFRGTAQNPNLQKVSEVSPPVTKRNIPIPTGSRQIPQNVNLPKVAKVSSPEAKQNISIATGSRQIAQNVNLPEVHKVSPPVTKRNIPIPTGSRKIPQNVNLPKVTNDLPPVTKRNIPIPTGSRQIPQNVNLPEVHKVSPPVTKRNIPIPTGSRKIPQNVNLPKVTNDLPPVTKRNIPIPTGSRQIPQNVNLPKVPKVSLPVTKGNIPIPTGSRQIALNINLPKVPKVSSPEAKQNIPIATGSRQIAQNVNLPKVHKVSSPEAKLNILIATGSRQIAQNINLPKVPKVSSPEAKQNIPIATGSRQIAQNINLPKVPKVSSPEAKQNIPIATGSRQTSNLQKVPVTVSEKVAYLPKTDVPSSTKYMAIVANTQIITKLTKTVVQASLVHTQKEVPISLHSNQAPKIQNKDKGTPSNAPKLTSADQNIQKAKLNVPKGTRYIPIDIKDDDEDVVDILESPKTKAAARSPNTSSKPPDVTPVNTLRNKFLLRAEFQEGWLLNVSKKYDNKEQQRNVDIIQQTKSVHGLTQKSRQNELDIQKKLQDVCIASDIIQIDDSSESEAEPCEFPELTTEDIKFIEHVSRNGPEQDVIIEKFNLRITRRDLSTLVGLNWLNDEVINFYMNLLAERSELLHDCGYPSVYSMNTFFVPRLMQSGHAGVRRWTRKTDIFSYDIIPVPVHVGQVHWCMAIIHMKDKTIKYYDSMGTPNPAVLTRLKDYLQEESLDKRKIQFSMDDWIIESVRKLPRQMNGSDCGVFSCMFAEYITRNKSITFSQQNMEYFRQKMIFEIAKGKLLT